jgi:hypothetical protein
VDDPQSLLQRRRIWGVPPDAVAAHLAAWQREREDLRAQIAALETRVAQLSAERDAGSAGAAALREAVARLEAEKAEWKDRPEAMRAEAIQFVVDAYAEARQVREEAAREAAAERAAAREEAEAERASVADEIAAMRREQEAERRRHEEAINAFREQEAEIIASLDAIGRTLLAQFGRADAPLARPSPLTATSTAPPGEPPSAPAMTTTPEPATPLLAPGDATRAGRETSVSTAVPAVPRHDEVATPQRDMPPEDAMLARALDELEAILRGNRNGG